MSEYCIGINTCERVEKPSTPYRERWMKQCKHFRHGEICDHPEGPYGPAQTKADLVTAQARVRELEGNLQWIADQSCTYDAENAREWFPCTDTSACLTEYCLSCYARAVLATRNEATPPSPDVNLAKPDGATDQREVTPPSPNVDPARPNGAVDDGTEETNDESSHGHCGHCDGSGADVCGNFKEFRGGNDDK